MIIIISITITIIIITIVISCSSLGEIRRYFYIFLGDFIDEVQVIIKNLG